MARRLDRPSLTGRSEEAAGESGGSHVQLALAGRPLLDRHGRSRPLDRCRRGDPHVQFEAFHSAGCENGVVGGAAELDRHFASAGRHFRQGPVAESRQDRSAGRRSVVDGHVVAVRLAVAHRPLRSGRTALDGRLLRVAEADFAPIVLPQSDGPSAAGRDFVEAMRAARVEPRKAGRLDAAAGRRIRAALPERSRADGAGQWLSQVRLSARLAVPDTKRRRNHQKDGPRLNLSGRPRLIGCLSAEPPPVAVD